MERTEVQQKGVERIIKEEVYCLQNEVVEFLLKSDESVWDDLNNLYYRDEDQASGESDNAHEIFQWFCISPWLAEMLDELKYPVIISDYGNWMGRICYGSALEGDGIWDQVLGLIEKNYQEALRGVGV